MILQADFGMFQTLTDYGVLGFAVLALGYLVWHFLQKLMKSEEDYRNRVEELEGQYREDLEKKLEESTTNSKSLKETILMFLGRK
jgi:anaerobic C4-dicarboxylate transporter